MSGGTEVEEEEEEEEGVKVEKEDCFAAMSMIVSLTVNDIISSTVKPFSPSPLGLELEPQIPLLPPNNMKSFVL